MSKNIKKIDEHIKNINELMKIGTTFDVVGREVKVLDRRGYLVFVDGLVKDDIMYYLLSDMQRDIEKFTNLDELISDNVAYVELDKFKNIKEVSQSVLSGMVALFIDGESEGILIDARQYPTRSIGEAESEKISKGAKDCFVETIVFNTALIRRRLRTENLIFEMKSIGEMSKTDIAVAYIDGIVDKKLLDKVNKKLNSIKTQALTMPTNHIEELLFKPKWYNPMPTIKYTERPEIVTAHLLEGNIAIIIDTSPEVVLLPISFFTFTQYADDYNRNFLSGSINRGLRIFSVIVALFLVPMMLMIVDNPEIFGDIFAFMEGDEKPELSTFVQILILEIGFILLQMSSLHTPTYLGGTFGIIGGLLISDIGISIGLFGPATVFFMALTAICTYNIPSVELVAGLRIFRFVLLIATGIFGIMGFVLVCIAIILITATTETLDRGYFYPILPFNAKALRNMIFRRPLN